MDTLAGAWLGWGARGCKAASSREGQGQPLPRGAEGWLWWDRAGLWLPKLPLTQVSRTLGYELSVPIPQAAPKAAASLGHSPGLHGFWLLRLKVGGQGVRFRDTC